MWCGVVRGCWAEWGCTGLGAGCGVFTSTACSCCAAARISAAGAGPPKRRAHLCLCVPSPLRTQVYLCQWRAIPVAVKVLLSAGVRPGPSADQAVLTVRQPVAQKLEEVRPGASQTPHAGWCCQRGRLCPHAVVPAPAEALACVPAGRVGAPTDRPGVSLPAGGGPAGHSSASKHCAVPRGLPHAALPRHRVRRRRRVLCLRQRCRCHVPCPAARRPSPLAHPRPAQLPHALHSTHCPCYPAV